MAGNSICENFPRTALARCVRKVPMASGGQSLQNRAEPRLLVPVFIAVDREGVRLREDLIWAVTGVVPGSDNPAIPCSYMAISAQPSIGY